MSIDDRVQQKREAELPRCMDCKWCSEKAVGIMFCMRLHKTCRYAREDYQSNQCGRYGKLFQNKENG